MIKPARVYTQSRHIPTAIKVWVAVRDEGRCTVCGTKDMMQYDHDPAWNLQDPENHHHDPDELFLKCKPCHDLKSTGDTTRAAKWKRVGKKHRGEIVPKGKIKSRGFSKVSRPFQKGKSQWVKTQK